MNSEIYFAYGSNINLHQMAMRCPEAVALRNVTLQGYELSFRGSGVATIIPKTGAKVQGVLWSITPKCEQALDVYEGFPRLYYKESVVVKDKHNTGYRAMVYIMSHEFAREVAEPPATYFSGIMQGYKQNGLNTHSLIEAVSRVRKEVEELRTQQPCMDFKDSFVPYKPSRSKPKNRGR